MLAATDRLEFIPPPAPGLLRALALAVLAHIFLLAALTWGVQWKREAATLSVEAELWSALPQEAAPAPVEVPLPPATQPVPAPLPEPAPVQVEPAKVDIAIEQEKLRLKKLKEKELIEKKRLQEQQQKERQAAEDRERKKVELEKQRKQALLAKQEAQRIEAQRSDNLKRIAGLAGASGTPDSKGAALRSSGPSGSYAGRVSARIKPNIVFTEDVAGNPVAEVDVRLAPNGSILSRKLTQSSGIRSWDEAVLKAIDKTEKLPPDTNGTVPSILTIGFRPKD